MKRKRPAKREAQGVCCSFQRGECHHGAGCKFSHDEQRAASTGWGPQDKNSRRSHNRFESPTKSEKSGTSNLISESTARGLRSSDKDSRSSRTKAVKVKTKESQEIEI